MKWQLVIGIFRELAPTASMGAFFHLAPLQNEWPTPAIQYADGLEWGKKLFSSWLEHKEHLWKPMEQPVHIVLCVVHCPGPLTHAPLYIHKCTYAWSVTPSLQRSCDVPSGCRGPGTIMRLSCVSMQTQEEG